MREEQHCQANQTSAQNRDQRDLSENELREQVELLRRQLTEAQKLTALGELVGTTTHEFNNVLMTIINYARLGLRHNDEATRVKSFEKILAASSRANKIVNSILGIARNRCDRLETICLSSIIEDAMVLMERELQKYRIGVEYDLDEVPSVRAIGNQLQQVVMNLLINARQAMPDGGKLVIRLKYDESDASVALTIRDYGKGISQDQLPRIFDLGYTTKNGPDETGRGGSGFGLHACRNIIEQHRGKIRVESSVGQGTAFTIRLPAAEPAADAPPQTPLPQNSAINAPPNTTQSPV